MRTRIRTLGERYLVELPRRNARSVQLWGMHPVHIRLLEWVYQHWQLRGLIVAAGMGIPILAGGAGIGGIRVRGSEGTAVLRKGTAIM